MIEIKSCPMDSHGHVYISRVPNKDQTTAVTRRFFFMGQHDEILVLYHKSNDHDLKASVRILTLHLSL